MKRVSFSTTSTSAAPALRMERVRPPGPGPTSHTWASLKLPAWRTILSEKDEDGWPAQWCVSSIFLHTVCELHTNLVQLMHLINYPILCNQMSSSESWVSKLRLIVCDVTIPVWLCVMKMRCINLTVTLFKDKRADQSCTASLIIILRLQLCEGCKQLTRSVHIRRRSTQPRPYRKACQFQCLETSGTWSCAIMCTGETHHCALGV